MAAPDLAGSRSDQEVRMAERVEVAGIHLCPGERAVADELTTCGLVTSRWVVDFLGTGDVSEWF